MANLPPNYNQGGPGALVTSRYDFLSHYEGLAFRHTADQIDLLQALVIGGHSYNNVETALFALYGLVNVSTNIFSTNPGPFQFLITSQSPGTSLTIENDAGTHSHTKLTILDNNVQQATLGNLGIVSGATSFVALWLGNSLNPSLTNYVLTSNGTNTYLNAPSGGNIQFQGGGSSTYATLGSTSLDLYCQFLYFDASITNFVGIAWTSTATGAGHDMYITGQGAGGTANAGGNINLHPGAGTTSGTPGSVFVNIAGPGTGAKNGTFSVKDNNNVQCVIANYGASGGSTSSAAMWLGPTVASPPSTTGYALLSDGTNTTINAPGLGGSINFTLSGTLTMQLAPGGLQVGPVNISNLGIGGVASLNSALIYQSATVPLTSGGSNILTSAQYACPYIVASGTLSANTTITFPNVTGGLFILNTQSVTYSGHTLTVASGSGSRTVATSTLGTYLVFCNGSSQVFVTTMS